MKTHKDLIVSLNNLEKDKRETVLSIKDEMKYLDEHSILRLKGLAEKWVELNFEVNIIYKILS